jgi:phenylacetate-CoA ligase
MPPVLVVESGKGRVADDALGEAIRDHPRDAAGQGGDRFTPYGSLPRSDYKSKLVDWSEAE